jgi:hypothetical protein
MTVHADGTFLYGGSRVVGGGAGWGGDSGAGDYERGQWKTVGKVIHIREAGGGPWQPYARYYIEGGRMMLTFGDGSKQIWYRN